MCTCAVLRLPCLGPQSCALSFVLLFFKKKTKTCNKSDGAFVLGRFSGESISVPQDKIVQIIFAFCLLISADLSSLALITLQAPVR